MDSLNNGPQPTDEGNLPPLPSQPDTPPIDGQSGTGVAQTPAQTPMMGIAPSGHEQTAVGGDPNTPNGTSSKPDGGDAQEINGEPVPRENLRSGIQGNAPQPGRDRSRGQKSPDEGPDSESDGRL